MAQALAAGFGFSLATLAWVAWHFDDYAAPAELRALDPRHIELRPGRGLGLALGLIATALIGVDLL